MIIHVLLSFLIVLIPRVTQAQEEPAGFVRFTNFPKGIEESLVASLKTGAWYSKPLPPAENHPTGVVFDFWIGNTPEFEFSINDAKLSFGLPDSEKPNFDITFAYREGGTTLRHSHPGIRRQKGGLRFTKRKNERIAWHEILYGGSSRPLVGVFLPKEQANLQNVFLLCLREPKNVASKEEQLQGKKLIKYMPSGHILRAVDAKVEGGFYAKVLSGINPGKVKATLSVSKNIVPSDPSFDQAFARDPEVGFDYFPKANVEPNFSVDTPELFGSGVQVKLDLRNGAGYQRISKYQEVLWVKQVEIDQPIVYGSKGNFEGFSLEPGPCYIVARHSGVRHKYTRTKPPIEESKELN